MAEETFETKDNNDLIGGSWVEGVTGCRPLTIQYHVTEAELQALFSDWAKKSMCLRRKLYFGEKLSQEDMQTLTLAERRVRRIASLLVGSIGCWNNEELDSELNSCFYEAAIGLRNKKMLAFFNTEAQETNSEFGFRAWRILDWQELNYTVDEN